MTPISSPKTERAPLLRALVAQCGGCFTAMGLAIANPALWQTPLLLAAAQGAGAAGIAALLRSPGWWLPIHLGFVPLIVVARMLELAAWVWPTGFVVLLLVFWRTDLSRVPLYLTNSLTAEAVLRLIAPVPCKVLDLGCGNGALLRQLARARPDCRFIGVEHAPLLWVWAKLRCGDAANVEIRYGNLWDHPLAGYALIYAFLSPAPMAQLWHKAQQEMHPGARLVSNSFEVPGSAPEQVVEVADQRRTRLYCYSPAD